MFVRFLFPLLFTTFCVVSNVVAQSTATSQRGSLRIVKEIIPPNLNVDGTIRLVDASGKDATAINANESYTIQFRVKNTGRGDAFNSTATITATGTRNGLTFSNRPGLTIKSGATQNISIPVTSDMNTRNGTVVFTIAVNEPNGFGTDKTMLEINTRAFDEPLVKIVDYTLTGTSGGSLSRRVPFDLQVLLQNTKHGRAENVNVEISVPNNVFLISGSGREHVGQVRGSETRSLVYTLVVNNEYTASTIPVQFRISEKHGKYAENRTIELKFDQTFNPSKRVITEQTVERDDIVIASLRSDVDVNIPENRTKVPNRFALIIGNEDYRRYQRGLQAEANVEFAAHDAAIFKEYCLKTLGVEEKNLFFITDATSAVMKREIERVRSLVKNQGGNAELIFYYAGHGFPDEATQEPYLMPVDVSGSRVKEGIHLYDLYRQLSETGAQRITVFLDACFSGGGRDAGLLAARGVRITPKKDGITGNLVVFSATEKDQTALPFRDKQHGKFTYFLLKKLQETNGAVTYAELYDYLRREVNDWALRTHAKEQRPEVLFSPQVADSWRAWRLR